MASQKGVNVDVNNLNKSEASQKIDELKNMTANGSNAGNNDSAAQSNDVGGTAAAKTSSSESSTATTTSTADAPIQDPSQWSTGDDKATDKQKGYIAVMAKEAGARADTGEAMTKTEASQKIEELKEKTGM